jgi:murein DD-endopeptidase MepM/ murein hydrolase activator NlpD
LRPEPETREAARREKEWRPKARDWVWPLESVDVTSAFGTRGRAFHEGLDLRASPGTAVRAMDAGEVVYSGDRIRGYGRMIVLRHDGGLFSVYAHNSRLEAKKGERVSRGQKIASTGRSGRSKGPHLHFEVRSGSIALDPSRVLPAARESAIVAGGGSGDPVPVKPPVAVVEKRPSSYPSGAANAVAPAPASR